MEKYNTLRNFSRKTTQRIRENGMEIRFRLAYCGLALASYASAAGLEKIAHAQEILGQDPTLNYGLSAGMFLAGIGCAYAATRPERLIESLIK